MAKKKVAAIVKIQIPAGAATPAPPVGTALGPHGVAIMDFCKAYNAATEAQRGTIVPVEITIFEDRSFTFVTKTPPTAGPPPRGRRHRQGRRRPRARRPSGTITDAQVDRDRHRSRCPTSTPTTSRRPSCRWPAPPAPWASRRRLSAPAGSRTDHLARRSDLARGRTDEGAIMANGKKYTDATKRFDRDQLHSAAEALDLVKSLATAKFDETVELAVRLGVDPRKADQMVRGTVALPVRHRQGRPRRGVRRRRRRRRGPRAAGADIVGADDLVAAGRGRHARLRRRHRHARPDAARSAGSAACSAPAA